MMKELKRKLSAPFSGEADRGVSPVIGAILMVAITVILAAVIGAFVLGLGNGLGEGSGPQAQLSISGDADNVTISHNGGDTIENAELKGSAIGEGTVTVTNGTITEFSLSAGDSIDVAGDGLSAGTLNVVVGDNVIASYEVPETST
ncbi:hypothetical protein HAPAU_06090 [Halalkalicoccus paucihalophilus]|uniref:Archaeal Type IV pilin N-terminal domain-containing protein n=1 Tax=Halalkalicoccus paucihalophilus TaxID=1008153 RepID=A0A151AJY6_9EURY|nr:type IV pilin N-terminal domain-containing protein [Halalkalicoccus paucihalophilus]KYH27934.1 hypothetical protein HAPAU_06090 [Halalkalicoccus paucihalophilus]